MEVRTKETVSTSGQHQYLVNRSTNMSHEYLTTTLSLQLLRHRQHLHHLQSVEEQQSTPDTMESKELKTTTPSTMMSNVSPRPSRYRQKPKYLADG